MSSRTGRRILRRTVTRNATRLTAGSLLIGVHQACEALVPILIEVAIDRAVATGDPAQLGLWLAALAGLFVVLTMAYRHGARQLVAAIAAEAHRLRLEVAAKILHPRGVRTDLRAGDLLTITATDADQTAELLDHVPRVVGAMVAAGVSAAPRELRDSVVRATELERPTAEAATVGRTTLVVATASPRPRRRTGWWCWTTAGSWSKARTPTWSRPAAGTPRCGPPGPPGCPPKAGRPGSRPGPPRRAGTAGNPPPGSRSGPAP